jgi:hypothetical protein
VVDPGVPNKSDYHLCPPLEYYLAAFRRQPGLPRAVFSDDVPWCRQWLPHAEFYGHGQPHPKEHEAEYRSTTPTDWIDFFLLTRCKYFIITGSTFGIWAAVLANVPPTNVVRPNKVYGPLVDYVDESLMFDPDWRIVCF